MLKSNKTIPTTPKKAKAFEQKFMRPDELAERWGLSLSAVYQGKADVSLFQKHGMQTIRLMEIVRQRDPELKRTVAKLSARRVREAVDNLQAQGRVIEVADETKRLRTIASAYCEGPENTLVTSPANRERIKINSLIHRNLQSEGKVSRSDHQMSVLFNRQDITGMEGTFANSYVPDEDIIRYNQASKVYGVNVGDYARVTTTDHASNTINVEMEDGRNLTYNPSRLSGVSVYKESTREFAEGDRIQFRAPFVEKRIANGELGSIVKIEENEFRVALDSGREVSFEPEKYGTSTTAMPSPAIPLRAPQ